MLYARSRTPTLDPALFAAPTSEFRGAPFWSWNCQLDRARLFRQIEALKAMGMGGFHMHARVGLATEYLGEEFLGHVRACVEKARQEGMLAWLYDEDRWPSGFAGGLVTRDERHRAKHLLLTTKQEPDRGQAPHLAGTPRLVARYAVRLDGDRLGSYRRLREGEAAGAGEREWRAFVRTTWSSPWFNNMSYVDTLSRPAIERFLELTHERYRAAVGKDFGGLVPAIFTDEPAFEAMRMLPSAESQDDVLLSWTDDFAETYRAQYEADPLDTLPELVWQLRERGSARTRWRYHDHNTERFASGFADTIGAWCERHGILFTGHMMEEHSLWSQTRMIGEAMRSYRGFTLPGIDLLCDNQEFTTAKQAQSAARQFARPGVMSELYGVTGWDFDFAGHKRQGDWQAALGITVRVPHLSWVSMGGEAKRDYPAALDEHSPWYREYPLVETHFARVNTALTRGTPICRVGVIHPIESYWLCWGPDDQTRLERDARETAFQELTRWLLYELVDFDFVAESLLPRLCPHPGGRQLTVGAMAYDVILVPGLRTIRATTLARLEAMVADGGTVLFLGEVPSLVDGEPSSAPARLASRCTQLPWSKHALLPALEPWRELRIGTRWGAPELVHQLRQDGEGRWLFLCSNSRTDHAGLALTLRGRWRIERWDTLTGERRPMATWASGDGDVGCWIDLPACGSHLLRLEPLAAGATLPVVPAEPTWKEVQRLGEAAHITRSEPNVLLLDQAEYRLDQGPWEGRDEILRLGQRLRARVGLPPQGGGMAQPWVEPPEPPRHRLALRWRITTTVPVRAPRLALEGLAQARLRLDGRELPIRSDGWWVDEAIATQPLPDLEPGEHVLEAELPFGRATPCEWAYLLGDFGVEVRGSHARLIAEPTTLAWGDWTRQGLPFYAGNITYHCTVAGPGTFALRCPQFRAPLLTVDVDGTRAGPVAFPPYQLVLPALGTGRHALDLTAYGSRINAFGPLHHTNMALRWCGPDAWRSRDDDWSDEYMLRPCGILTAPRLLAAQEVAPASPH